MKRTSLLAFALLLVLIVSAASPASAATVAFKEDFSSGKFDKWTNGHLDDDPETPDDREVIDVATIKDGQLHVSNKDTGGSFFYIAPKDIKAKNFKVSMKVKSLDFSESWVGFSVRKDVNDRYNGSNNILHTFIFNETGIAYQPHRGYPGGGGVISLAKNTTEHVPFTDNVKDWHTFTLVAKDNIFTAMVDDQVVGVLDYGNAKVQNAGYISINVCVGEVIIDDVIVEVHDDGGAAPEPAASKPAPSKPAEATNNETAGNAVSSPEPTATPAETAEPAPSDSAAPSSEATEAPEASASPEASSEPVESSSAEASASPEAPTEETSAQLDKDVSAEAAGELGVDEKKSNSTVLIIILVSIVLLGGGGFGYWKWAKK